VRVRELHLNLIVPCFHLLLIDLDHFLLAEVHQEAELRHEHLDLAIVPLLETLLLEPLEEVFILPHKRLLQRHVTNLLQLINLSRQELGSVLVDSLGEIVATSLLG